MLLNKIIKKEIVKKKERFFNQSDNDKKLFEDTLGFVLKRIDGNLDQFTNAYPSAASENLIYRAEKNETSEWTAGFWTGMLWLAHDVSADQRYRGAAEIQLNDYIHRLNNRIIMDHHDIGFLYILSCVAAYKVTGNKQARQVALEAADLLASRYLDKAKIIQVRDRAGDEAGTFIIDCSMNIPLLYWASNESGDSSYREKAYNHIQQVARHVVREDASTYHCFKVDVNTGEPVRGWTGQGYQDTSCWARGQAWAIYGFALSYGYTKDEDCLDVAKKLTNYFLNRLPVDNICNWDLDFLEDDVQRDSSAAAIAACGMLELSKLLPVGDEDKELYEKAAVSILKVLAEKYITLDCQHSNGVLKHGVYCKDRGNGGWGDDECCIWGDYFFMEGLIRRLFEWRVFW